MKKLKYEDITIQQAENIMRTGCFTEIIFDGDNRNVSLSQDEFSKLEKTIEETLRPVFNALLEVSKAVYSIAETFVNELLEVSKKITNKKITKKKFIKLLQSNGIQRNEINKVIQNNEKEYTYLRYCKILNKLSKDERK